MTPVAMLLRTVSIYCLRFSSSEVFSAMCVWLSLRSVIIWLNESMSVPSSSLAGSSTWTDRLPRETSFVARASFSIGTVMPFERWNPIQEAAKMRSSVMNIKLKR